MYLRLMSKSCVLLAVVWGAAFVAAGENEVGVNEY